MMRIKPGDLVESFRSGTNITNKRKRGVILSRYFEEVDWFYVLCNGKKERWHISNIVLV